MHERAVVTLGVVEWGKVHAFYPIVHKVGGDHIDGK